MLSIDENARRRFEADWLIGENSLSIREYLPGSETDSYIGTLEELVCIDLEFRWKPRKASASHSEGTVSIQEAAVPTRVEDYVRDFPELNDPPILQRLVEQEIYVRVNAGYTVEPAEYQSRFPELAVDESLFTVADNEEETKVDHAQPNPPANPELPKLFGKYEIKGMLGRGGMGTVYRAHQAAAGRDVALKIAEVSRGGNPQILERFKKEALAAASFAHDNVVPVFDVGEFDGKVYMAMQLVGGGDLGERSKASPLPPKEAAEYIRGIAAGVEAAHANGMLHRDIKPANILVDAKTNRAMLTDFGLARAVSDESGLTQHGQLLGTPSFMPPEQIRDSSAVDGRADVYALGGSLYQLLTGRPPFKTSDIHETLRQVLSAEPVEPILQNAQVDLDLNTICLKCLEKEPEARYQSAQELADELGRYLADEPIIARPLGTVKKAVKWSRRNPRLAVASGLACIGFVATMIAVLVGWFLTQAELRRTINTRDIFVKNQAAQFEILAEDPRFEAANLQDLRNEVLGLSLKNFQLVCEIFEGDSRFAKDQALAFAAIARIHNDLRFPDEQTRSQFGRALNAIENLPESERSTVEVVEAESNVLVGIANYEVRQNDDPETALKLFKRATELREQWVRLAPEDPEAKRKLANSTMNEGAALRVLGNHQWKAGDNELASQSLAQSEGKQLDAYRQRLAIQDAGDFKLRRDLAKQEFNLGLLELQNGALAEALFRFDKAMHLFEELAGQSPSDGSLWVSHAEVAIRIASLSTDLESFFDDEAQQEQAVSLLNNAGRNLEALWIMQKADPEYRLQLLLLGQRVVDTFRQCGAYDMASQYHAKSKDMFAVNREFVDNPKSAIERELEVTLRLHFAKQDAFLALQYEPESAPALLQNAIQEFTKHVQVVERDPLLEQELKNLKDANRDLGT